MVRGQQNPSLALITLTVIDRFDIYSFGFNTDEDEVGMIQSARSINQLIMNEVESGMDPSRIILGGFSQGATMSLLTGMMSELKLGGIIVLSGWLTLRSKFKEASCTFFICTIRLR